MDKKRKNGILRLCPVRLGLTVTSLLWIVFYFSVRGNRALMNGIYARLVRSWHETAGRFYSLAHFSAAEWVIAAWIVAAVLFLVQLIVCLRGHHGRHSLYRWGISLSAMVSTLFALYFLWWGCVYYADSLAERTGLTRRQISAEELESVTRYYVNLCNEYSDDVERDADGLFTVELTEIFDHSPAVYRGIEREFPCLSGPELRAKPAVFSRALSLMNVTGYFFSFTAEANVNVDMPPALLPATIAHELAHQRGVAMEDEANFCAVIACVEDTDVAYRYSGALMAYVYLGNALHDADYERWSAVYELLNEDVRADLRVHNAYWARYDTPVADATDAVYEQVLRTVGDDRGLRSYDACVDLLTVYYIEHNK